ncbi:[FeFe] hydrogenase H-cluster maturation GTPase HydF [Bacilli bacterium PM5-3]|nr:[FeFe] hydrogenase H-cluster maturation GTPase HydF [Bacilli bacterium PM5-3]
MEKIPSLIPTIVFIGKMNAGKSSLINAITNQEVSIVSDIPGTTSDEIVKRIELLNVGPINLIDTAGFNDESDLGDKRVAKTNKALKRADLVIYLIDANDSFDLKEYDAISSKKIIVFSKIDLISDDKKTKLQNKYPNALFISVNQEKTINDLKNKLTTLFQENEEGLLKNIKLKHKKIIHVIPIDSEAPKGRLILPQMQLLRECLDLDIVSIVLKESELENYLEKNDDIDLIVTDSQAFKIVSQINNERFFLTSYSILQANQKGDLQLFVENINYLQKLSNPKILIMESCSHNTSHEDIGKVKIPKMLNEMIDGNVEFEFVMGHDFPDEIKNYDFIVHCGSCMLSKEIMQKRIKIANDNNIPITNYGLIIAHYNGILNEAIKIFNIKGVINEKK